MHLRCSKRVSDEFKTPCDHFVAQLFRTSRCANCFFRQSAHSLQQLDLRRVTISDIHSPELSPSSNTNTYSSEPSEEYHSQEISSDSLLDQFQESNLSLDMGENLSTLAPKQPSESSSEGEQSLDHLALDTYSPIETQDDPKSTLEISHKINSYEEIENINHLTSGDEIPERVENVPFADDQNDSQQETSTIISVELDHNGINNDSLAEIATPRSDSESLEEPTEFLTVPSSESNPVEIVQHLIDEPPSRNISYDSVDQEDHQAENSELPVSESEKSRDHPSDFDQISQSDDLSFDPIESTEPSEDLQNPSEVSISTSTEPNDQPPNPHKTPEQLRREEAKQIEDEWAMEELTPVRPKVTELDHTMKPSQNLLEAPPIKKEKKRRPDALAPPKLPKVDNRVKLAKKRPKHDRKRKATLTEDPVAKNDPEFEKKKKISSALSDWLGAEEPKKSSSRSFFKRFRTIGPEKPRKRDVDKVLAQSEQPATTPGVVAIEKST